MTWSVIELPTSDIDVVILVKQEFDNKQLEIFYVVFYNKLFSNLEEIRNISALAGSHHSWLRVFLFPRHEKPRAAGGIRTQGSLGLIPSHLDLSATMTPHGTSLKKEAIRALSRYYGQIVVAVSKIKWC